MIEISCSGDDIAIPISKDEVEYFCHFVLDFLKEGEKVFSLAFIDSSAMREMNGRYRGKDAPTDVLSFCFLEDDSKGFPDDGFLGELYVSPEQVAENAKESDEGFDVELLRVITHGILHLSGYSHEDDADLDEVMRKLESEVVADGDMSETQRMFALQEHILAEYSKDKAVSRKND